MLKKSLFIVFAMSFPLFGQAQNMDPKTEQEYAQVIMECYTENIPKEERWEELKFSYTRGKTNSEGKKEIAVSAKYTPDNKKWKEAPSCHPLAPMVITETYLKNIGKYDENFKSIELTVEFVGNFKVKVNQK